MADQHTTTQSDDVDNCRWDLTDPDSCWDESSCGCYTDPCTFFGWDKADCCVEPCCVCCWDEE
ncbi:MAG: hypothetical protein ACOWWM_02500 [Desulfobacterales bacterium]